MMLHVKRCLLVLAGILAAAAAKLARSSGSLAADAEAIRIAGMFRFEAAKEEGEPVPVLVRLPISFYR